MHLHRLSGRIIALILILMTLLGMTAYADTAMISAKNARIYANDSLTGKSASAKRYTLVDVVSIDNGVAKVSANGYTVYIDADMLTVFDDEDVRVKQFAKNAKAYQYPSTKSRSVTIKNGTEVNVLAVINNVAVIEKDGVMAYTYWSALTEVSKPAEPEKTDETIYADYEVIVTSDKLSVYSGASTSAKVITTLKKGEIVNLVAYNSEWAIIEKNGVKGCCKVSGIEKYEPDPVIYDSYEIIVTADTLTLYGGASTSAKVLGTLKQGDRAMMVAYNSEWAIIETEGMQACCKVSGIKKYTGPKFTMPELFASDKYTNEQKIFYFLVYEVGYSPAAACGVLANIKCESTFRPTAYNPNGGSYGICQWLGGRYTNLKNWCAENGYDYTSLEGQCWFLKYELEHKYTKVHSYMKNVENSAQGAYDAGYYYCYHFEIPANRGSVSIKRGNMARDDFWPKYSN